MPTPFDLTDQVAVITGSSRGIGRSIAETMASLGAKVVVSSRKPEPCEEVAAAIRKKGGEAIVIPCNISRKPEVEALVSGTLKAFGKIDILVCNAAVNPVFGPLTKLSDEAFDKIMGANVKSNLWLCNLVIPGMAARGGGAVVIISSIGGMRGSEMLGAYAISKSADFALARCLAVEWGPRPRAVGGRGPRRATQRAHAVAPHRHARRDRPGRRLPRLARRELHHRPDPGSRRRRDHHVRP